MKALLYPFTLVLVSILIGCGPKEEKKICASGVRKEFTDGPVYATVEEGCVIKLSTANLYKANGSINLKITPTTNTTAITVQLNKGLLTSNGGEFVIKSNDKSLKVRLISGQGSVKIGDKEVALEPLKVLEVGS